MEIKKHKIKISSEGQSSGFVLDLRSKETSHDDNRSISSKDNKKGSDGTSIHGDISFSLKNCNEKDSVANIEKSKQDIKDRFLLGGNDDAKKNIKKGSFLKRAEKTILFFLLSFTLKITRKIVWFFVDWVIDIYYFFRKSFYYFRRVFKSDKLSKTRAIKSNIRSFTESKKKYSLNKNFSNIKNSKKNIWFFLLILFVLVIPFKIFSYYKLIKDDSIKESLLAHSSSGLDNFVAASLKMSELDLGSAQKDFFRAGESFLLLDKELKKIDEFVIFLASFSGDENIRMASESKKISKLGIYLSLAGDNFTLAIDSLMAVFLGDQVDVDKKFSDFYYYSGRAESDFKMVNKYLSKIKEASLPEEYRYQFADIKNKSSILEKNLSDFIKIIPGLKDFLAINDDKRYLIVFQNNAEMRATGGFIGSYALIDLKKGRIKNVEIPAGGSYDTEGGMRVRVESPRALHLVKPIWYFWDANWWPDWKMSAENLMWFYEKSGGPSVDGVIGVTPDVLDDILKIVGPIDLSEKYGVVVDSNNFWETIQEIVEVIGQPEIYQNKDLKTDILSRVDIGMLASNTVINNIKTEGSFNNGESQDVYKDEQGLFLRNEPKEIIGDLMTLILDKFSNNFDKELLVATLGAIEKNLTQKNILLYFKNSKIQNEVESRSWGARVKDAPLDYLMIINSSVAGGKTDYFIDNDFSLNVNISEDGTIINKLTIKRNHLGDKNDLFSGIRNVNWLRVYVPLGSSLISANGFSSLDQRNFKTIEGQYEKNNFLEESENRTEIDLLSNTKIYQESNKTVFANWNIVDPGENSIIEITYKLPYNFYSYSKTRNNGIIYKIFPPDPSWNYSLLWQKQAGSRESEIDINFYYDLKLDTVWTYPDNISGKFDQVGFKDILNSDRYFVIMLK